MKLMIALLVLAVFALVVIPGIMTFASGLVAIIMGIFAIVISMFTGFFMYAAIGIVVIVILAIVLGH